MPYRLDPRESVDQGLRRCAREQLDRAIDQLTEGIHDDPVEAVHDARKALKKERSLLRLFRGALTPAERRRENEAFRDAGRHLSAARDAEVMLQAVDDLSGRFAGQVPKKTFDAMRRRLEAERDSERASLPDSTSEVAEELKAVRRRIDEWQLTRKGWRAVEPGVCRGYRRGHRAFERVRGEPSVESLHEWRKRTKDLWYHLRLLTPTSAGIVGGQAKEAHRLSDLLGDDHDLAVLRDRLESTESEFVVDVGPVFELIDHRREQLQRQAMLVGERLYAETPKAFRRRLHRYWKTWRREARAAEAPRPMAPALA
jgi:CHAD domain-containing protein